MAQARPGQARRLLCGTPDEPYVVSSLSRPSPHFPGMTLGHAADLDFENWAARGSSGQKAPDTQPAAGELRIRVEASGVNFADIMGRLGLYPDLPRIPVAPGYEVAGSVDVAGAEVDASWIGRDVFARPTSAATPTWFASRRSKSPATVQYVR